MPFGTNILFNMHLLDLFFPKRCVGCGKIGGYFCSSCIGNIQFPDHDMCPMCEKPAIDGYTHPRCRTKYAMDGLTSIFAYKGVIRGAVKELKYRGVFDLATELGSLMPQKVFGNLSGIMRERGEGVIIPIPLHAKRLQQRGFNQAAVVGKSMAQRLHITMDAKLLRRVRETTPQVQMRDRDKRIANMKDVFSIHDSQFPIHNSSILLIDDVFTTGATMRAATNVLKRAGVRFVWGVTIAR